MNTGRNSKQTTCLCRDTGGKGTLLAQHTSFNTLNNWGHKTPTQSKRKRNRKERLKGHGPKHVYNTLGYIPPLLNHNQRPRWLITMQETKLKGVGHLRVDLTNHQSGTNTSTH